MENIRTTGLAGRIRRFWAAVLLLAAAAALPALARTVLRFTVPPAPDAESWYLEIPYSAVDRVTLYSLDVAGQWLPQTAGDNLAVDDWPVPHRHPLLPLGCPLKSR